MIQPGFSGALAIAALLGLPLAAAEVSTTRPAEALKLSSVEPLQPSFNPTAGETASMRLVLSRPARVSLTLWGPNHELIAQPANQKPLPAGISTIVWDGRDVDGRIVPDEAYTFEVQAASGDQTDLWDPLLTSGGDRVIAGNLDIPSESRITYELPRPSRVLVRAAVDEGPLVRTLVNWEPRAAGLCIEEHDGLDVDGLRRLEGIPGVRFGVMAFALPDKAILATGNRKLDYRRYFEDTAKLRRRKARVVRDQGPTTIISPHWLLPPHLNKDPRLSLRFVEVEKEPTTQPARPLSTRPATATAPAPPPVKLTGASTLIRVDMPDADERAFMNNQKFELIIYVNDRRILEVEQGHVPFNYPWDLTTLPAGRHLLTVNVSSFRNHVGTISRYVEVAR